MKISAVIASLGKEHLLKTIDSLNRGSITPNEIICVLPSRTKVLKKIKNKNVKILFSKKKNQIIQRNIGLMKAKHKYVLQVDDDILLSKKCLENMLKELKKIKNRKAAVGPIFFDDKKKLHYNYKDENFFSSFIKYLFCSAPLFSNKAGKITSIGVAYLADFHTKKNLISTEWLPGGCVLYLKKNILKMIPIYLNGKSYCEDVFYSLARRKANINHYVVKNAHIIVDKIEHEKFDIKEFFKEIFIRKKLLKSLKGSQIKFYIWCYFEFVNRFFKSLVKG